MYILNYLDLEKGDIILDRKDDEFNKKVGRLTNCDYVHARMYVGGTIIESEGGGVQPVNPQRILYKQEDDVVVLRPVDANRAQIEAACIFARSESAKEYGGSDYKRSLRPPSFVGEPNRQFCTRLVAQAYRNGGYPIVDNADYCTAGDIFRSDRLYKVTNMVHEASKEEIEMANSTGIMNMDSGTNTQNDSLVILFNSFRNASGDPMCDIQNETEFVEYLISHQQLDSCFNSILCDSEYYSLWKRFQEEKPEEFDPLFFIARYGNKSMQAARQLLEWDDSYVMVWRFQYKTYSEYYQRFNLQTFKSMKMLYKNLLDLDDKRKFTLRTVIRVITEGLSN